MIKNYLHTQIIKHHEKALSWFAEKSQSLSFPFYSSYDIRDSQEKISPVDANLFPAGFNNICDIDRENAVSLAQTFLEKYYPKTLTKGIIVLAEEHTNNPYYWDNIFVIQNLLKQAGLKEVFVCVPGQNIKKDTIVHSAKGHTLKVFLLKNKKAKAGLIVSNNDFSVDYNLDAKLPIEPPPALGWRQRRKHTFFEKYNKLVKDFSQIININPALITIKTERFMDFNASSPGSLNRLKENVNIFLEDLKNTYKDFKQKPFVFLKNNFGTYGLGITMINSAKDIDDWNYNIRKKMKASKGGAKVTELILQEGIATSIKTEGAAAEPVIYLVGSKLAGGFLRTHKKKSVKENLNSPGAVYQTLCLSDLNVQVEGLPKENVYGWIAHLGVLALAEELKARRA